jgi:hypothetical protein
MLELPFCQCGCGEQLPKPHLKFLTGHHLRILYGKHLPKPLCACGCGKTVQKSHHTLFYGHVIGVPRRRYLKGLTPEERFWAYVNKTNTCWLWTGTRSRSYGVLRISGKTYIASRLAWEYAHGPIPDGLEVCHDCPEGDNPLCCNPSHLWLGTQSENAKDMYKKGRAYTGTEKRARGSRNANAKLTEQDIEQIYALRRVKTRKEIAEHFKVGINQIHKIFQGDAWVHVPCTNPPRKTKSNQNGLV